METLFKCRTNYIFFNTVNGNDKETIMGKYTLKFLSKENNVDFEKLGLIYFPIEFRYYKIAAGTVDHLRQYVIGGKLKMQVILEQMSYHNYVITWESLKNQEEKDDLSNDFDALLTSQKFSDFMIKVDGKEIAVHKNILATRCSVFCAMLENDFSEKKLGYLEITDMDSDTVSSLIRFLYTNKVTFSNVVEVQKLLAAADKYDVSKLKRLCERYILDNMNVSNVVDILTFSGNHNVMHINSQAVIYAVENFKALDDSHIDILFKNAPSSFLSIVKKVKNCKCA